MRLVERAKIVVADRQRTEKNLHDAELRRSILEKGLLHPVVVAARHDGTFRLVAGGRRLSNIDWIAADGKNFSCDGVTIAPGEVPTISVADALTDIQLREAEFEENFIREDLPWQDRIRALADIHRSKVESNPQQSVKQTAVELAAAGGIAGSAQTTSGIRASVAAALVIDKNLDDPQVRQARNAAEAFQHAVARTEAQFAAEVVRRRNLQMEKERTAAKALEDVGGGATGVSERNVPLQQGGSSPHVLVRQGNALEILPSLQEGIFDLILGDPPYAINAGAAGFRSRTVHHHNYDDSPEATRAFLQCILTEGHRVCKARANLFLLTDIDLWPYLQQASKAAGWTPFRTPIIWQKSQSEGLAPWGRQGPRRTYEMLFFATKGGRGLIHSPVDILSHARVPRAQRDYGAAKPPSLMQELIECSTIPGDQVLDPCCGSGATLVAALKTNRRALGIDMDQHAVNLALLKLVNPPSVPTGPELATEIAPSTYKEPDLNVL